jgi:hypothetical protein
MAARDAAIDGWVRRAFEAVRAGGSLSAHPHMILDASVPAQEALAFGKEAFMRLVPLLEGSHGVAYLMVSVGLVPIAPGALTIKATEVEAKGIEGFVQDQLDVAVGVAPADAHWKNVEVVTTPVAATVFKLPIEGAIAYIRGMSEQEDTEWSVDAVLSFEWPPS